MSTIQENPADLTKNGVMFQILPLFYIPIYLEYVCEQNAGIVFVLAVFSSLFYF